MGKEGRREDAETDTPEHKGTAITYASLTYKPKKTLPKNQAEAQICLKKTNSHSLDNRVTIETRHHQEVLCRSAYGAKRPLHYARVWPILLSREWVKSHKGKDKDFGEWMDGVSFSRLLSAVQYSKTREQKPMK